MKTWQRAAIMTLMTPRHRRHLPLAAFEHRRDPGVSAQQRTRSRISLATTPLAVRMTFPTSFDVSSSCRPRAWDEERLLHSVITPSKLAETHFPNRWRHYPAHRLDDQRRTHQGRGPSRCRRMASTTVPAWPLLFSSLPGSPSLYATVVGAIDAGQEQYLSDSSSTSRPALAFMTTGPNNAWLAVMETRIRSSRRLARAANLRSCVGFYLSNRPLRPGRYRLRHSASAPAVPDQLSLVPGGFHALTS